MESDFMDRTAKIIAKIHTVTYIDKIDAEAIKGILQEELNECYDEGYDNGHSDGHSEGYSKGYYEGRSDGRSEGLY